MARRRFPCSCETCPCRPGRCCLPCSEAGAGCTSTARPRSGLPTCCWRWSRWVGRRRCARASPDDDERGARSAEQADEMTSAEQADERLLPHRVITPDAGVGQRTQDLLRYRELL